MYMYRFKKDFLTLSSLQVYMVSQVKTSNKALTKLYYENDLIMSYNSYSFGKNFCHDGILLQSFSNVWKVRITLPCR